MAQKRSGERYERSEYTPDDQCRMLKFLKQELEKGNIDAWKPCGNKLWEKAAARKVTGHSIQSMRDHMRRHLLKNLEFAPVELTVREYIKSKLKGIIPLGSKSPSTESRLSSSDVSGLAVSLEDDIEGGRIAASTPISRRRRRVCVEIDEDDELFLRNGRPPVPVKRRDNANESVRFDEEPRAGTPPATETNAVQPCAVLVTPLELGNIIGIDDSDSDSATSDDSVICIESTGRQSVAAASCDDMEPRVNGSFAHTPGGPDDASKRSHTAGADDGSRTSGASVNGTFSEDGDEQSELIIDESPAREEMENQYNEFDESNTNRELASADDGIENQYDQIADSDADQKVAAIDPEAAVVSPDESFESASAASPPRNQPFWRRFVAAAEVKDREAFAKKLMLLERLAKAYDVPWPALRDTIQQLRTERSIVDLMTVEITLWKRQNGNSRDGGDA